MIKHTPNHRVYAPRKRNSGFTLIELTVVMAVLGILLAAGLYGFNQYIQNAQGATCTQQLADISRACNSVSAIQNWTAVPAGECKATTIQPYLGGRLVNGGGASDISCPAGAANPYVLPTAFVPPTTQLNDPICGWVTTAVGADGHTGNEAGPLGPTFKGTRLHSLGVIP